IARGIPGMWFVNTEIAVVVGAAELTGIHPLIAGIKMIEGDQAFQEQLNIKEAQGYDISFADRLASGGALGLANNLWTHFALSTGLEARVQPRTQPERSEGEIRGDTRGTVGGLPLQLLPLALMSVDVGAPKTTDKETTPVEPVKVSEAVASPKFKPSASIADRMFSQFVEQQLPATESLREKISEQVKARVSGLKHYDRQVAQAIERSKTMSPERAAIVGRGLSAYGVIERFDENGVSVIDEWRPAQTGTLELGDGGFQSAQDFLKNPRFVDPAGQSLLSADQLKWVQKAHPYSRFKAEAVRSAQGEPIRFAVSRVLFGRQFLADKIVEAENRLVEAPPPQSPRQGAEPMPEEPPIPAQGPAKLIAIGKLETAKTAEKTQAPKRPAMSTEEVIAEQTRLQRLDTQMTYTAVNMQRLAVRARAEGRVQRAQEYELCAQRINTGNGVLSEVRQADNPTGVVATNYLWSPPKGESVDPPEYMTLDDLRDAIKEGETAKLPKYWDKLTDQQKATLNNVKNPDMRIVVQMEGDKAVLKTVLYGHKYLKSYMDKLRPIYDAAKVYEAAQAKAGKQAVKKDDFELAKPDAGVLPDAGEYYDMDAYVTTIAKKYRESPKTKDAADWIENGQGLLSEIRPFEPVKDRQVRRMAWTPTAEQQSGPDGFIKVADLLEAERFHDRGFKFPEHWGKLGVYQKIVRVLDPRTRFQVVEKDGQLVIQVLIYGHAFIQNRIRQFEDGTFGQPKAAATSAAAPAPAAQPAQATAQPP
ncbi:MAG: hypothetical protein WCG06_04430, partial [Candidatus Omnitrophota bacterium]